MAEKKTTKRTKNTGRKPAAKKTPTKKKQISKKNEVKNSKTPMLLLIVMGLVAVLLIFGKDRLTFESKPTKIKEQKQVTVPVVIKEQKKAPQKAKEKPSIKKEAPKKEKKVVPEKKPAPKVETKTVKIYLVGFVESTEKYYLHAVYRRVKVDSLLKNTINQLLQGPTVAEENKGLLTAMPANLKLRSAKIKNRVAYLDFNSAIEHNAFGTILINRLDQIVYTATQFDGVDSVLIMINGQRRKTLGTDGLSLSGPLHRRHK